MAKSKKKIIVFGGSGFLGSHVSDALTNSGHQVIIVDKFKSKWLKNNQAFHKGDINNTKTYEHLLKNVNAIFNFAALSDIKKSNDNPLETVKVNILGVVNLLNLCLKKKSKNLFRLVRYMYPGITVDFINQANWLQRVILTNLIKLMD